MKAGKRKPLDQRVGGGGQKNIQAQQMQHYNQMKQEMDAKQEEIEAMEADATAGGGAVSVKVNGKKELTEVKIDPDVMDPEDPEMLQDLIIVAVNEAIRKMDEIANTEMEKVTGGLNLPI
jgi:DNA-binding YbaB/EbfC family protein